MARPLNPLNYPGNDMFVILAYDVHAKRCAKVMKYLKQWLQHHQRSLFVGFLTDAKLKRMQKGLMNIIDVKYDSVILFKTNAADQITQWRTLGAMIRGIEGVAANSSAILQGGRLPESEEVNMRKEVERIERRRRKPVRPAAHSFVQPKDRVLNNDDFGLFSPKEYSKSPDFAMGKPRTSKRKKRGWDA